MGLATPENKKQLKQLMKDRKKKAYELKRLQSKQKASNKYRVKRRKIVRGKKNNIFFSFVEFSFFLLG
jgi:transposase